MEEKKKQKMRYEKALNAELLEVVNTEIYLIIWKDIEKRERK